MKDNITRINRTGGGTKNKKMKKGFWSRKVKNSEIAWKIVFETKQKQTKTKPKHPRQTNDQQVIGDQQQQK